MSEQLGSATVFCLGADPPCASLAAASSKAELDAAVLVDANDRHPCSIRKLSAAGTTLRVAGQFEEGARMHLELATGQGIEGTVRWRAEDEVGFVFDHQIDVIGTVARNLAALPAERRAMPRIELHQPVSITVRGMTGLARTRNISQGGAGIETTLDLSEGDAVQLVFDGLRPMNGAVRWIDAGQVGIAFAAELGWQMLMPWLRHVQRHSPQLHASPDLEGMIPDKHAIRLNAPARVREGVRWWTASIRGLTSQLVELETRASLAPGAQLWVSLPEIGGGPACVIEVAHQRLLCEFRLPLTPRDLGLITGVRARG
jgi:hypothetical protein